MILSPVGGVILVALRCVLLPFFRAVGLARRKQLAPWIGAAGPLVRILPFTLALAIGSYLVKQQSEFLSRIGIEPVPILLPGLSLLACSVAASGCYLLLLCGSLEGSGRRRSSRRQARQAGFALAMGAVAQTLLLTMILAGVGIPSAAARPESLLTAPLGIACGAILSLLAGFVGLLGGLSGKPRPSGRFATLLYLLSLSVLLA